MILLLLSLAAAATHDAVGLSVREPPAPVGGGVPLAAVGALHLDAVSVPAPAWPQLACVGGGAFFDAYRLPRASCAPEAGGERWRCEADPAPGYRVTNVRVVCQAGRRPGYVQAESCAMHYELEHDRRPLAAAVGPLGWALAAAVLGCVGCACLSTVAVFLAVRHRSRRDTPYTFNYNAD